jgi:hypothetical protein
MRTTTTAQTHAGFLPPPGPEPDPDELESAAQDEADADEAETVWLTAREVAEGYAVEPSTFKHAVLRNAAGLMEARRVGQRRNTHRRRPDHAYEVYEYPQWRINQWFQGEPGTPLAATVFGTEQDWYLDQVETDWLKVTDILERTEGKYTTFMRAVSRNQFGLWQSRYRPRHARGYVYPAWRVDMWCGKSQLHIGTLPSLAEIRRYRASQDAAASALARKIGFSPAEVSAAAAIGDLPAGRDPNTGNLLFMAPRQVNTWLDRDSWQQAS